MNQTLQLIANRRSLRAFSDEPISDETLETLKEMTLRAPTAGNQMFYSIIEVTDPARKAALAELCDSQVMIATAPIVWIFLADVQKWENFYSEGGSYAKGLERGIKVPEIGLGDMHLALQDAIIAAQNAVISGEALGLGSCYIGDIVEQHEKVKALLGLTPHVMVAAMLIMGYPKSKERTGKQSKRCPASAVFMENYYKEPHLEQLKEAYKAQEQDLREKHSLPDDNTGSIADRYYFKKHTSTFMAEMNRSAQTMIDEWKNGGKNGKSSY
ncbi:MAG: nitroreductase family protein [Sphaerochaetaceae bacterium]|jgi:nitroreductase|nr:nitroreductase family protein [Sphaerochaetaceae bacterium]MDD3163323.1 nitroreductase family protein [Sphaerochaetaceae bacterium]MDD4007427.1 nitroreductase family protein [Sphaerochaetaceae bacterium]MDD4396596.1 nitroreductase family protein [Sphaerochaetaceae bacterium]